jgi:hypothetical protein
MRYVTRTIGNGWLFIYKDGDWSVDRLGFSTLEDRMRGNAEEETVSEWKVKGKSAIPSGSYKAHIAPSPKHGCDVVWLENVPGFENVQIHIGNGPEDTEGCILVGEWVNEQTKTLVNSRVAFEAIMEMLKGITDITVEVR